MTRMMNKDPAIKLFGRTIPVHEANPDPTALHLSPETSSESEKISQKEPNPKSETLHSDQIQTSCTSQENQTPTLTGSISQDPKPEPDTPLKKPDKIIPCPRCKSMETKFCYYNNYNINQPRHFCKNCQRYWTAGGTMRNVPVGAGRRKNKHPNFNNNINPQFRHVMLTSPEQPLLKFTTKEDKINIVNNNNNNSNNTVEENSSCVTSGSSNEVGPSVQCYNLPAGPGFVWGPMPLWHPGPWWTGFAHLMPSSPGSNSNCASSGFGSPLLGKHSRQNEDKSENNNNNNNNNLYAPKTMRIVDADEAAKSSIWTSLGFKHDEKGIFKNFKSLGDNGEKDLTGRVLNANPAALSRFQSFQERT